METECKKLQIQLWQTRIQLATKTISIWSLEKENEMLKEYQENSGKLIED